jgi:predicted nucleic acid-binding protein
MVATVVLDTNIFVGAGFNPRSDSARIVAAVREGRLRMVWNEATRRETERILRKIPPLHWSEFSDLFRDDACFAGETHPNKFAVVPDPEDRKFAALATAVGASLVTLDAHLLDQREQSEVSILPPTEFLAQERME